MWSRGHYPEAAVDGLPEPADGILIIVNAAVAVVAAELGRVDLVTPEGWRQHENKLHCEHLLRVNEALPIAWGGAPARPTEALVTYDAVDLVAMGLPVDVVRAVMRGARSDHRAHASLVGDELAAFRRGVALYGTQLGLDARARYKYETAPTPNRGDLFVLVETLLEWRHHRPLHGTVKAGRSTGNAKSAAEVADEAEAELGRAPARADSETAHFRGA